MSELLLLFDAGVVRTPSVKTVRRPGSLLKKAAGNDRARALQAQALRYNAFRFEYGASNQGES